MHKDYGFSYEIYAPGDGDDVGPRIDYGDDFHNRSSATAVMRMAMKGAPPGSTSFVCKRYRDGEMTQHRHFAKREQIVMLKSWPGLSLRNPVR